MTFTAISLLQPYSFISPAFTIDTNTVLFCWLAPMRLRTLIACISVKKGAEAAATLSRRGHARAMAIFEYEISLPS